MSGYTEDQLRRIAQLAEHLDSTGQRGAARQVRHHLSILRTPRADSSAAEVLLWAATLVADAARDRDAATMKICETVATMQACHQAATEGGPAVAELVDTVIVSVVMLLAPMTFINRTYPVVGELVVLVDDLTRDGDLTWPVTPDMYGRVLAVNAAKNEAQVTWTTDEDACWFDLRDLAGLRTFGKGE